MKTDTLTIGQLAKRFGLSRSALLYYDAIGLLKPSERSAANYRRYTKEDARRLQLICTYRQVGLPMASIRRVIEARHGGIREILEERLLMLGTQIGRLREQQQTIIRMLGDDRLRKQPPVMDRDSWVTVMRAAGLDDEGMRKWHEEFEKFSPALHQEFLQGLGLGGDEIEGIRQRCVSGEEEPSTNQER